MRFHKESAEIYVPDGAGVEQALARTTHLAISAHQDDLEIMSLEGILDCFGQQDKWYLGVVATNGAGSPRDGLYAKYTDEEMRQVRRIEQKKAAFVGEYSGVVFLDYSSSEIKNGANLDPVEDIKALVSATKPEVVYLHNLADKHDTHVSTALRAISAIRSLPQAERPKKLYGCEVWRSLDWLVDSDKVVFMLDKHDNIAMSLVGIFDSQIVGGKRYDIATQGRRRANATYHESHAVDVSQFMNFGMNLTPLIVDETLDINEYVQQHIQHLAKDVCDRLTKFS